MKPISNSICAAKWYNATIWLGSGHTASCHHTPMHEISIEALRKNPKQLHNTPEKKASRQEMLDGKRPSECDYCWRIEDLSEEHVSDRVYKTEIYTDAEVKALPKIGADNNIDLKTLEIAFDRNCNFACSYCGPSFSSKWGQDITANGYYQNLVSDGATVFQQDGKWAALYKNSANNPYIHAFWKWWPELRTSLQELRITGGEPMLSQDFWKFMESLANDFPEQLRLAVNSNLGARRELVDRLISVSHGLKEFDFYTSCEAVGEQAEYIRDGLDYELFCENIEHVLRNGNIRVFNVMMTINSLCLFSLTDFLDQVLEWKQKFGGQKLVFSTNILSLPKFMSPTFLPSDLLHGCREELLRWLEKNQMNENISVWEHNCLNRLVEYIKKQAELRRCASTTRSYEHDFKSFYTQYDERRGKSLSNTFPMLADWYNSLELIEPEQSPTPPTAPKTIP